MMCPGLWPGVTAPLGTQSQGGTLPRAWIHDFHRKPALPEPRSPEYPRGVWKGRLSRVTLLTPDHSCAELCSPMSTEPQRPGTHTNTTPVTEDCPSRGHTRSPPSSLGDRAVVRASVRVFVTDMSLFNARAGPLTLDSRPQP